MKNSKEMAIKESHSIRCEFTNKTYTWFISCVAAGMYEKDEAAEVANIVKSTSEIEFARWYA